MQKCKNFPQSQQKVLSGAREFPLHGTSDLGTHVGDNGCTAFLALKEEQKAPFGGRGRVLKQERRISKSTSVYYESRL